MLHSESALRLYFQDGSFARGEDFGPKWHNPQLVETGETAHCDRATGGAVLLDTFAHFMDTNDLNEVASYGDIAAIFNRMHCAKEHKDMTNGEIRLGHLHAAICWLAFDQRRGVSQQKFAEAKSVTERTVQNWITQAVRHIAHQLRNPEHAVIIIFPESYRSVSVG